MRTFLIAFLLLPFLGCGTEPSTPQLDVSISRPSADLLELQISVQGVPTSRVAPRDDAYIMPDHSVVGVIDGDNVVIRVPDVAFPVSCPNVRIEWSLSLWDLRADYAVAENEGTTSC